MWSKKLSSDKVSLAGSVKPFFLQLPLSKILYFFISPRWILPSHFDFGPQ